MMLGSTSRSRPKTCIPIAGWGYGLGTPTATSTSCTTSQREYAKAGDAKSESSVQGKRDVQQHFQVANDKNQSQSASDDTQHQHHDDTPLSQADGETASRCNCKDRDIQIKLSSKSRESRSDFMARENSKIRDLAEGVTGQQLINLLLQNDEQNFLQNHRDAGATGKSVSLRSLKFATFHHGFMLSLWIGLYQTSEPQA